MSRRIGGLWSGRQLGVLGGAIAQLGKLAIGRTVLVFLKNASQRSNGKKLLQFPGDWIIWSDVKDNLGFFVVRSSSYLKFSRSPARIKCDRYGVKTGMR